MRSSDQELIERARQGDNSAFGRLWTRYEAQVVSLCRHYLSGPYRDPATEAHDLASETFILALHGLHRYEDRSRENRGFETWLLEIAKRRCLKFLDRQRRRQQWLSDEPPDGLVQVAGAVTTPRLVEEREVLRLAAQEINALPEHYRRPFQLSLEEYSHKEIAQMMGIRADTAMQRVHRARRMLQARLAPVFGIAPKGSQRAATALRSLEQAISEIVRDSRIVNITLAGGGEIQLCLRVDRRIALRGDEIVARRRRLERYPRAWKPFLEFADLCYHCGRWQEAREAYRAALARQPACFAAALRLAEMLRREEQAEEAAQVCRAALEQSPPPDIAARLRAAEHEAIGNDAQAVEAYRDAIAQNPAECANYYGLHRVLGRLSRYAEQLENLAALRTLAPDDLFAYDEAYTPCARLERWDMAVPLLECALEIDPNHPVVLKHLFQVRMNQQRYDVETLGLAERLVRLAPDFVESWSELAWIYAELGRDEESLAVLHEFLREHPGNAEACAALAWRYHYLDRLEDLAVYARRAYQLDPHNWHVCWTQLNACGHKTTAISDAERSRVAEEILEHFPEDAFLLERICFLYANWGRHEEALGIARRLRALQPDSPALERRLAEIHRLCHKWEEAVREYRRLLEQPDEPVSGLLALLGEALRGLQDPAADAAFAEAEERANTWYDYLLLADTYERCALHERALAMIEHLLSLPFPSAIARRRVEAQRHRLRS